MVVDVILPVPVPNTFSYLVSPFHKQEMEVGKRVVVQFGKTKLYTGIVRSVEADNEGIDGLKEVIDVLDTEPILSSEQIKFWDWMSDYYMCTIGEVMVAALPAGLKLQSESKVVLSGGVIDEESLTDREFLIYEALMMQHVLSIKDISSIIGIKTVQPIIKSMITKGVVFMEEELKAGFKEKTEKLIALHHRLESKNHLDEVLSELERTPAQMKLFMEFLSLKPLEEIFEYEISKKGLKSKFKFTDAVFKQLLEKEILEEKLEVVSRLTGNEEVHDFYPLTNAQQFALDGIKRTWESKDIVLFHGVTGAGKTEVYVRLIKEALDRNEQVLYLLPEIALTTQLIHRLQRYFGVKVGVYHSRYSNNEQVEIWNAVKNEDPDKPKYDIVIGARSSMFLPFKNLGLVIVDEEHETSFKQFDPAPRYHARDAAIMLAYQQNAKVLLGSATPSLESYWNAKQGRYGYVPLTERFGNLKLPQVFCADVQKEQKQRSMKGHFSKLLRDKMEEAFSRNEQIILFQNKRGFAPMQECQTCAHVPQCVRCDVSLTYHKHYKELRCHYCGYKEKPSITCHNCGSIDLKLKGFGTEKIEEELADLFPKARVARMDSDTTKGKHAYYQLIRDFEEHNIDVLVGTQMVTKGLDFDNVGLVGIMNADNLLNWPDFRSNERAYHLMAQVSGRAGRKKRRGTVVIQSYNPEHAIIRNVIDNNYEEMFSNEILQRKNFFYPPFYRLVYLTVIHSSVDLVNAGSLHLAKELERHFGSKFVLGPEFPSVARIKLKYHKQIILKIDKQYSIAKAKAVIKNEINHFLSNEHFRPLRVVANVDPL